MSRIHLILAVLPALLWSSAGQAQTPMPKPKPAPVQKSAFVFSVAAALGKAMFFDQKLSASGKMSCASCHSPEHAYGPPNGLAAQLGGADMHSQGTRAVPSLRYILDRTQAWGHGRAADPIERMIDTDNVPSGGFTWDGRFNRLSDQASFPMLNPSEMANKSPAEVVVKLARAPYAARFRAVFGDKIFESPEQAFAKAMYAIQRFELEEPGMHPYDSKFDYYLDGKVKLSAREMRGKMLFEDPQKGNCASCHITQIGADGSHPLLTDFNYEALGVPRNRELKANADPAYFDMGLCGPVRTDKQSEASYCGLFKTPSLRNTAQRKVFFHNGRFHTLKDALRFYFQRDTNPEKWYPAGADGKVKKYDDLPARYRDNVDVIHAPMDAKAGAKPVLSEHDMDDLALFIKTFDDGYILPATKAKKHKLARRDASKSADAKPAVLETSGP